MNDKGLAVFKFQNTDVRSFLDDNGEPLFVASDVCAVLDLSNISQALSRLDEDEKREIILNDVTGRKQSTAVINESGLYSLILTSRKPEAKAFKKWVTSEVLPSIRKTGSYDARSLSPLEILEQQVALMRAQGIEIKQLDVRVTRVEATISTMDETHMTIKGYCSYKHYRGVDESTANKLGRQAAKLSRARGYSIGETMDRKFGKVNDYHVDILAEVVDPYFS